MHAKWVVAVVLCGFAALTAHAEFQAGAAWRSITPEKLLHISGGVGPGAKPEGFLGDLNSRAIVVEQNDTRVAIVSVDSLGFTHIVADRIRAKVPGIPAENILIGATHTHSAPDMYAFPNGEGGTNADLDYLDFVIDQTAEAINAALDAVQPASVRIATGRAEGKIAYNYYAPQLYDPRCSVIQFIGTDGDAFATLVNYAIHPEVLNTSARMISPDLVGPLYERIEELGGGMGLFMNGAQGGMITADNRTDDGKSLETWDEAVRIGRLLADEAMRIVHDAAVIEDPGLYCTAKAIEFPIDSPEMRYIFEQSALTKPLEGYRTPSQLNLVNLGSAQMLTIPGEALPNIGYYLKRNMKGEHNLLFGLTNDAYGYILLKEDFDSFDRYAYITRTSLGEMTAEIYIEEALALVDASPAPAPAEAR